MQHRALLCCFTAERLSEIPSLPWCQFQKGLGRNNLTIEPQDLVFSSAALSRVGIPLKGATSLCLLKQQPVRSMGPMKSTYRYQSKLGGCARASSP